MLNLRCLILLLCFLILVPVHAEDFNSSRFHLEDATIDLQTSETNINTDRNIDPGMQSEFENQGYIVIDEGSSKPTSLQLNITNSNINFGMLEGSNTYKGETKIKVNSKDTAINQLFLSVESPMKSKSDDRLEDTNCDSNLNCTIHIAQTWKNKNTYGIGYSLQGLHIPTDFINKDYFRSFPSTNETLSLISDSNLSNQEEINMLVKIQTPPDQKAMTYTSVINIIATTSY